MKSNGSYYTSGEDFEFREREPFYLVGHSFRLGVQGWRKKCIYLLLIFLLIMIITNLCMTLWIIKVLDFSTVGMGLLQIVNEGLKLKGNSYIVDNLTANSIKSRTGEPLSIESNKDFMTRSRNANGILSNYMHLGLNQLKAVADQFTIVDQRRKVLFFAETDQVFIGSKYLIVPGEVTFDGSVSTGLIKSEKHKKLRLETSTRKLNIVGANGVNLESRAGSIEVEAYGDFDFTSQIGRVSLSSNSLRVPLIPAAKVSPPSDSADVSNIYQICVCENGRLFMAPSRGKCDIDTEGDIC